MLRSERALKARVNPTMNRAFSARVSIHRFPEALPQAVVECCAFGAKQIQSRVLIRRQHLSCPVLHFVPQRS